MIQLDDGKQQSQLSGLDPTGEEFRSETSSKNGDVFGLEATTAPNVASESEDVFVYVSPPPTPFPRVFPGL